MRFASAPGSVTFPFGKLLAVHIEITILRNDLPFFFFPGFEPAGNGGSKQVVEFFIGDIYSGVGVYIEGKKISVRFQPYR